MTRGEIWSELRVAWDWFWLWVFVKWRRFWLPRRRVTVNCGATRVILQCFDDLSDPYAIWEGKAHFAFWGSRLPFHIHTSGTEPDQPSIQLLRTALETATPPRADIERTLFEEYRAQIPGNYDFYDSKGRDVSTLVAPRVQSKSEFLRLISNPRIAIAAWDAEPIEFSVHLDCTWSALGVEVRIAHGMIDRVSI